MVAETIYFQESSLLLLLYFLAVAAVALIWGFLLYHVFKEVFREGERVCVNLDDPKIKELRKKLKLLEEKKEERKRDAKKKH